MSVRDETKTQLDGFTSISVEPVEILSGGSSPSRQVSLAMAEMEDAPALFQFTDTAIYFSSYNSVGRNAGTLIASRAYFFFYHWS